MRYKLLKDWDSKLRGRFLPEGTYVIVTRPEFIEELIEMGCIEAPKKKTKKKKKTEEEIIEIKTEITNE